MSRKKKLLYNTAAGLLKQLITVICGFVLPRYFLIYYGSSVNGLVSSITNFLSFIALLDMGVGAVIQSNLYKPLAEKNTEQISRILKSSERFFRRLSYIFIVYIAILSVLYPTIINQDYSFVYSASLIVIIAISTFAQSLFGMTYQLLLNSDQKAYIPLLMQVGTICLNTVLAVIMMKAGMSIHLVKLMTATVYILRPLGQMAYVRKHYNIDKKIILVGEPIKQKWNGFSQHFAAVVCQNIDIVVLTLFCTLKDVSVYSVYFNVTNGVEQIILTAATGLESLFGNMIANGERERLLKTFNAIEWIVHFSVTIIFTIAAICIVPFVMVYTRGITDANYIAPVFGALLVIAYGSQCLRVPYFRIIKAAGHFKETQNGAYISALLNIIITISFVFKFGLIGAAMGTLIAMFYHTCYFVWYLQKNILERSARIFVKYLITDCLIGGATFVSTQWIVFSELSYFAWVLYSLKVAGIAFAISFTINILMYKQTIKDMLKLIRREK